MSQDIIDAQQKQIETLLQRLNDLNSDHQALLESNKTEKKAEKKVDSPSKNTNLFSKFGFGLKEKFNNLTTPKNSYQETITDDTESEMLVKPQKIHFDYTENERIPMSPKSTTNVSVQTKSSNSTEIELKELKEENDKLKQQCLDLRRLYDDILEKYSDSNSTMDIRDGQIKDISMERNQLRKQLKQVTQKNATLMQVLKSKSKAIFRKSTSLSRKDSDKDSTSPTRSESANSEITTLKRSKTTPAPIQHKSNIFENVASFFKPAPTKRDSMTVDTVDIANKLMKVIQEKDLIIEELQTQIKNENPTSCSSENE